MKKLFFKQINQFFGLAIVIAVSAIFGGILIRQAWSAFTEPTKLPSDASQELGSLAEKIGDAADAVGLPTLFSRLGKSTDTAGTDTLFGKIAGVGGGGGIGDPIYITQADVDREWSNYDTGIWFVTTATTDGSITFNGLTGVPAGDAMCDAEFPGTHMATYDWINGPVDLQQSYYSLPGSDTYDTLSNLGILSLQASADSVPKVNRSYKTGTYPWVNLPATTGGYNCNNTDKTGNFTRDDKQGQYASYAEITRLGNDTWRIIPKYWSGSTRSCAEVHPILCHSN